MRDTRGGAGAKAGGRRWQRGRMAVLLCVALAAGALATIAHAEHLLSRPEQQSVDARYQIRGADAGKLARFALVDIDSSTFNEFRRQHLHAHWPFPRRYDARVIEALHRAGAKVIAYDVQFTEETDPVDDNALIRAIATAGNVVLGTTEVGVHGTSNVLGGEEVLHSVGARAGETQVISDSDGSIRRLQYSVGGMKTFGVAIAEADTGRPVSPALFGGATRPVPIDFAGPAGTAPSVSYASVYHGRFPAGLFAGRIVVVGASDAALQDLHQTPTGGTLMSGPELQANSAATVLAGVPLHPPARWVTALLIFALALFVPLCGARVGTLGVALAATGLLIGWALAAQLSFNGGTLLDFTDPAAALLLATGGTLIVGLQADSR